MRDFDGILSDSDGENSKDKQHITSTWEVIPASEGTAAFLRDGGGIR